MLSIEKINNYKVFKLTYMDKSIKKSIKELENLIKNKGNIKLITLCYKHLIMSIKDFINSNILQIGEVFYKNNRLQIYDIERTYIRNLIKKNYNLILPYADTNFKIFI